MSEFVPAPKTPLLFLGLRGNGNYLANLENETRERTQRTCKTQKSIKYFHFVLCLQKKVYKLIKLKLNL